MRELAAVKVACRFKDGTFNFIPGVKWHPEGVSGSEGLWAFESEVDAFLARLGKTSRDIDAAEAPVELCHNWSRQPWTVHGSVVRILQPLNNADWQYWNQH